MKKLLFLGLAVTSTLSIQAVEKSSETCPAALAAKLEEQLQKCGSSSPSMKAGLLRQTLENPTLFADTYSNPTSQGPNTLNKYEETLLPYQIFAKVGHDSRLRLKCVEQLAEKHNLLLSIINKTYLEEIGLYHYLPLLHRAALEGNLDEVKRLIIAENMSVNAKDEQFGSTPLHFAAKGGNLDVVNELLQQGSYIDARDYQLGATPLACATVAGNLNVVKALAAEGADVTTKNKFRNTPLHEAESLEMVKEFIDRGADIHARNIWGKTPLHQAAFYKRSPAIAKELIDRGASVNTGDSSFGWTPLHCAAIAGSLDIATLLVAHGAPTDAKDNNGRTPLDIAKKYEQAEIVEYLQLLTAKG